MTQPEPLLSVQHLQVQFATREGTIHAVEEVSFTLQPGQTLGVIGESGCGKTVTTQAILQLLPSPPAQITGGQILWHRPAGTPIDLLSLNPASREMRRIRWKEISIVFQEPMSALSPVHTIGQQISEAIRTHEPQTTAAEAQTRVIQLLERVGIARAQQMVNGYTYQYSGGMRQRAMIAMALACNPRLLIADEPTTALDVTVEAQILTLIKELQAERQMAVMYISHDLAVVGTMADEIVVMYLGVVVEQGPAEAILDAPLHPYTQALARSVPTIERVIHRLEPISGDLPSPLAHYSGCRFYSRCPSRMPGLCDQTVPALRAISPKRQVRCFLYEQPTNPEAT